MKLGESLPFKNPRRYNFTILSATVHPLIGVMEIDSKFLFSKCLTRSDVGNQSKLKIPRWGVRRIRRRYFRNVQDEDIPENTPFPVYDREVETEIEERFVYRGQGEDYVIQRNWKRFVNRKGLKAGDTVNLYWNLFRGRFEIETISMPYFNGV